MRSLSKTFLGQGSGTPLSACRWIICTCVTRSLAPLTWPDTSASRLVPSASPTSLRSSPRKSTLRFRVADGKIWRVHDGHINAEERDRYKSNEGYYHTRQSHRHADGPRVRCRCCGSWGVMWTWAIPSLRTMTGRSIACIRLANHSPFFLETPFNFGFIPEPT